MLLMYMLICYLVNCKTAKDVSLPKIPERLPPDFTSFTGSVHGLGNPGAELFCGWQVMV